MIEISSVMNPQTRIHTVCPTKTLPGSPEERGSAVELEPDRELEAALHQLRASPLVKDIGFNSGTKQGVYARLWCARGVHPRRDSEQVNLSRERTSLAQCASDLLKLIDERHGDHLAAAEANKAATKQLQQQRCQPLQGHQHQSMPLLPCRRHSM